MKTKLMTMCAVVGMILAVNGAVKAAVVVFDQGFESNTGGMIVDPEPPYNESITRVASGSGVLGVSSASGSYHAEVALNGVYGSGVFTRNGGYSSVWPGYIKQSIKVYIDPAAGQVDDGWFWDAAICDDDGVSWKGGGGGFGVRKTATGTWSLGAEDVYGGFQFVGNTRAPHDNTTPMEISTAGWYTLATEWVESSTNLDLIDQINTVYDSVGNPLWTDTVADYMSQTAEGKPGAYKNNCVAGGIAYSWLGSQASQDESGYDPHPYEEGTLLYAPANTMTLLAIDDVYAEIVPEPATMALLGLGGLLLRRKRRA